MPRSDSQAPARRRTDWRGWLTLAWAVWFGLLYGQMVVAQRGGKLRAWIGYDRPQGMEDPGRTASRGASPGLSITTRSTSRPVVSQAR
jgi:hypothetical protein